MSRRLALAIVGCRPPPVPRNWTPFHAAEWAQYGLALADVIRFVTTRAEERLAECGSMRDFVLVSGGARGVDSLAESLAHDLRCGFLLHRPDYRVGRFAPLDRNTLIGARRGRDTRLAGAVVARDVGHAAQGQRIGQADDDA